VEGFGPWLLFFVFGKMNGGLVGREFAAKRGECPSVFL